MYAGTLITTNKRNKMIKLFSYLKYKAIPKPKFLLTSLEESVFLQYNQPGEYILAGYAKNANTGERHQIYRGELIVTENLDLGVAVDDQTSFEEQMVVLLRAKCLRLAQNELIETDVNRVKIVREERTKARTELNFWEERWNWYRKQQAVANGRPNPNMIMPAFNIM